MKVSSLPPGHEGNPSQNIHGLNSGRSAPPAKLAAAKAIAAGQGSQINVTQADEPKTEEQVIKEQLNVRKIKMKTNRSPERFEPSYEQPVQEAQTEEAPPIVEESEEVVQEATGGEEPALENTPQPTPEIQAQNNTSNVDEQANAAEDTKPLSPQFAALARQRRALQVKERELADREKVLETKSAQPVDNSELVSRIKSQPLRVLQEYGVTYEQLTDAILNEQNGITPEVQALEAKVKSLEEALDKRFQEKDTQAEQAALNEMKREAEKLVYSGDDYEQIRITGSVPKVIELIHRTYKQTGEVLDVPEAMQLIEDELFNESVLRAETKRVKNKLQPQPPVAAKPAAPVQQQTQQKQIKTLTNRDNASMPLSRKERAIAAMNGTLKK